MRGEELKQWRESRGISQRDLAAQLDVSDSAVNRWENGQEIPGPAQLLLNMLINGEMPFAGVGENADEDSERKHFWKLRLTVEQWHQLESLAVQAGFSSTRDYLLSLIQDHLQALKKTNITPMSQTQSSGIRYGDPEATKAGKVAEKGGRE